MQKKDLLNKVYKNLIGLDFENLTFHNLIIINETIDDIRKFREQLEKIKNKTEELATQFDLPPPLPPPWPSEMPTLKIVSSGEEEPPPLPIPIAENKNSNVLPFAKTFEYKIMVLDEDPDVHNLIKHTLHGERNVKLLTERSPRLALQKIKEQKPDLVMLDINMKEMTCFEFLTMAQEMNIGNETEFIVGSYHAGQQEKIAALEMGASDYFAKPYDINEIKFKLKLKYKRKLKYG